MMSGLRVRHAGNLDELSRWMPQWNALADAQALPMLRYEWFAAAERHLARPGSTRVLYVLDGDENLTAALPLERTSDDRGRITYQILGHARLHEPTDLLSLHDVARYELIRAAASLGHPVVLSRLWPRVVNGVPCADAPAGGSKLRKHGIEIGKPTVPSQYLALSGDYEAYSGQLSSRHRYDIRRAYRRAAAAGDIAVEFIRPDPGALQPLLDTAFEVESHGWKGVQRSSVMANTDLRGFFGQLLCNCAEEGKVLTALLRIGSTPAAAQICLIAHERIWILKIGYDEAFEKVSPGLILMNELIRYGHQNRLCAIEFLGSAEPWLEPWRPAVREYRLLAMYPYGLRSLTRLGLDLGAHFLRRARRTNRS